VDPWLGDIPLATSYARLFELSENKLAMVSEMFALDWGVGGEAWKWRRRLFVWEEVLVGECVERLSVLVSQVGMADMWVWKLHPSNKYTVQSAYSYLTAVDNNIIEDFHHFLWKKPIPLKVIIFVCRLFLNRLATKDNLWKRNVLDVSQVSCVASCGAVEDKDHLFFQCDHYGRLWLLISIGLVSIQFFMATYLERP